MRPPREAYARGYAKHGDFECTVGIEWQDTDHSIHLLAGVAHSYALAGAQVGSHAEAVRLVESMLDGLWRGRAYFIETERDGAGVQVYQPFGMPRSL